MDAAVGGVHVRVRPVAEGHVVEVFVGFLRPTAVQRAFLLPEREYLVIFSVCCSEIVYCLFMQSCNKKVTQTSFNSDLAHCLNLSQLK